MPITVVAPRRGSGCLACTATSRTREGIFGRFSWSYRAGTAWQTANVTPIAVLCCPISPISNLPGSRLYMYSHLARAVGGPSKPLLQDSACLAQMANGHNIRLCRARVRGGGNKLTS